MKAFCNRLSNVLSTSDLHGQLRDQIWAQLSRKRYSQIYEQLYTPLFNQLYIQLRGLTREVADHPLINSRV